MGFENNYKWMQISFLVWFTVNYSTTVCYWLITIAIKYFRMLLAAFIVGIAFLYSLLIVNGNHCVCVRNDKHEKELNNENGAAVFCISHSNGIDCLQ